MDVLFLVIQIVLAVLIVGIILLQRSDSDGASALSGGSNAMGGMMSYKSASSFLVRVTAGLMVAFFVNSLILANLAQRKAHPISLLETSEEKAPTHKDTKHKVKKESIEDTMTPHYPDDLPAPVQPKGAHS